MRAPVELMQLEKIMKTSFELVAEFRETRGKGARPPCLRRDGKVPAILYGGHLEPRALTLSHQKLAIMLENERFYSTILNLRVGEETQAAILKDVQRHPFKERDCALSIFNESEDNEKIRISVPLHFKERPFSPGVKSQGSIVSHMRNEIEVTCLPKDLPEFIEVDISELALNESIHLSQLKIPGRRAIDRIGRRKTRRSWRFTAAAEEPEPTAPTAAGAPAPVEGRRHRLERQLPRRQAMRRRRRNRQRPKPRRNLRRKTRRSNLLEASMHGAVDRWRPLLFWGECGVGASTMAGLPLRIIVGLGNPGPEHQVTRHNAGFWFVDLLARRHGAEFRDYRKYSGETARISISAQDIILLKPTTYMNRSGLSIRQLSAVL